MTYPFDGAQDPNQPEPGDTDHLDAADYRDIPTPAELGAGKYPPAEPYRSDAELEARARLLADVAASNPWTHPETMLRFNPNPR